MCIQSEATLEKKLIEQLEIQGYEKVILHDEKDLISTFKTQLEKHNKTIFSKSEFNKILNHLDGGTIFEKSKKLRNKFELYRDEGTLSYIEFFNTEEWCKNEFQVSSQINMAERYKNRYDVTILINGLPLVQIELKRRGIELKEAFNQICRYKDHSFRGLFLYLQLFIISNGVNTRYFANNRTLNFKQSFCWTDEKNEKFNRLNEFADIFLEKCHLAKIISKYVVLNESDKFLTVLRPYQYFAAEKIIKRVAGKVDRNGYIWHTTGSGKTLTSFKASQILTADKDVDKVVFVVDRKDLDFQTMKEFNKFSKGSVDATDDTIMLVKQLSDEKTKLIITTIQKLNNAVSRVKFNNKLGDVSNKRIIFIFDECHRSQFGETHKRIKEYFKNRLFFGFTGTPIFEENSVGFTTTKDLFGSCLHKYIIKDAIDDDNVLGFSVEYYSTFRSKLLKEENGDDLDVDEMDKVKGINKDEVFSADVRLSNIVDFIIKNHDRKTYNREYNAIFAVSSIDTLLKYYELFRKKKHNLNIATIFSYQANEELEDQYGNHNQRENWSMVAEEPAPYGDKQVHTREKLDLIVNDYNKTFKTNFDLNKDNGFNAYFVDVSKKVKEKKIDILLVVNMFLTGFDSVYTNTLYVDKNLRYHGLIQAFSRTNRVLGEKKKYGNIVCFRNLKKRTDEAIVLFSNPDAIETVLMKAYSEYAEDFNKALEELKNIVPDADSVDKLEGEEQKALFVKAFRNLLRIMNRLVTFTEFRYEDINVSRQEFEDYRSKYLDIRDETVKKDRESILNDLDFEVELVRRDDINVDYILKLLKDLDMNDSGFEKDVEFILKSVEGSDELRSKRELIERFIRENLPEIGTDANVEDEFDRFISAEKEKEIGEMIEHEKLNKELVYAVVEEFEFSSKFSRDKIKSALIGQLKLSERKRKIEHLENRIEGIVNKYKW
jgi:type I restriction enzyme, R subunit